MKRLIVCHFCGALALLLAMPIAAENKNNEFSSEEIKNIRHLSRALIKSRANEKLRIDKETSSQKNYLKNMRDEVSALNNDVMSKYATSNVTVAESAQAEVHEMTIDGKTHKSTVITKGKVIGDNKKNIGSSVRQTVIEDRKRSISKSENKMKRMRQSVEAGIRKPWMIWKKDTDSDIRARKIVEVSKKIENEMAVLAKLDSVDMPKMKELKEKLDLKKIEAPDDGVHPTLQIRTKHRQ